jgi:hypothetical protein
MDTNNPHVVQQLRPVNSNGTSTATYQLSKESVSPTRIIGRDALGLPIEDTLPTVYWRPFLTREGAINKVPLRTGSVPSMHADAIAYENETIYDQVMDGRIPAWLCPYSTAYTHLIHGPFVTPPPGEEDCGGSNVEGGCKHLKALAKVRREAAIRAHQENEKRFASQHNEEFNRMREGIVAGVGEAIAKHMPQPAIQAARQKLQGKGEE